MTEEAIITACAEAFRLGTITAWTRHGGTAGKNWRVTSEHGTWLVRLRGIRTSSEACLAFDHTLRKYLLEHGVPTAVPATTRNGRTFLRLDGRVLEVYPFIEGIALEAADEPAIRSAARTLARFHTVCRDFPGEWSVPLIAQYATLGVETPAQRLEDPALLTQVYQALAARPDAERFGAAVQTALDWLQRLRAEFSDRVYEALPHTVVHGDYTLANLLFDPDHEVCGVFDLDWARRAPAVRDVADGMFFVAGKRRSPLRSGDIRSLTEPVDLDTARCAAWLESYTAVRPLTPAEWRMLPLALAARWLSVRAEGTAKVPPQTAVEFCFDPLPDPLRQIDERWQAIRSACANNLPAGR